MALNFSTGVTEIQAYLGKVGDIDLITTGRCQRWINEAQRRIIMAYTGLKDVDTLDKTTWKCADSVYEFDTDDFVEKPIAHILDLRFIDTANKDYSDILPYEGGLEKWDRDRPYPPDSGTGKPSVYVRRGKKVEMILMPGSNEAGVPIWVHYSWLTKDMSGTDAFTLVDFDEPITQWGCALGLRAMGKFQQARDMEASARLLVEERWQGELPAQVPSSIGHTGP